MAHFSPPLVAWAVLILCWLCSPVQGQDLSITLLNGDCDGDNEVTLYDFGILVNAFGSVPGDPNWAPRADLDGDMEVTLFDFAILNVNFGQIGAEPFDPTLPRQAEPESGYQITGVVQLQGWQGESQSLLLEALRDDDPEQVVYQKTVQSGQPFVLTLPQSGWWTLRVAGGGHFLTAESAHKREYQVGPPICVTLVGPTEGEQVADARYGGGSVAVEARVVDFDVIRVRPAGTPDRLFVNREIQLPETSTGEPTFEYEWQVTGSTFVQRGSAIEIAIPTLQQGEQSRQIRVTCRVRDRHPDRARRDTSVVSAELTFTVVNHPTVRAIVTRDPAGWSYVPVTSGYAENQQVRLRFSLACRPGNLLDDVPDENVQWSTPWGNRTGKVVEVGPISPDEEHRFFDYSVTVTFPERDGSLPPPPPQPPNPLTVQGKAPLLFALTSHDELNDTSRGQSNWGGDDRNDNPPNWFDDRPGHWGRVIPRMNAKENGQYIVHYANVLISEVPQGDKTHYLAGRFDWQGQYAPAEHRYEPAYRGRIYLFPPALYAVHFVPPVGEPSTRPELLGSVHGLRTNGVDFTAAAVAHEFGHRDLFIQSWGGFDEQHIGGPGNWIPLNREIDADEDLISNAYERDHLPFRPNDKHALFRWWTGNKGAFSDYLNDNEMYAQLWGEGDVYFVGSLTIQVSSEDGTEVARPAEKDWSEGGAVHYFYPNGK